MFTILIWLAYIALFFFLARKGRGEDLVLSDKVGFFVQSFAYVATYISAVALVGFGGLAYMYGMQMLLIALGNVICGTLFVYAFLTWRTKELQLALNARTPAHLLAIGHNLPVLKKILGFVFAFFLSVYASAVIKGAGIMLENVLPFSLDVCIWLLAIIIGLAVLWGGLKGVLLTEAMQGGIMLLGIAILAYKVLSLVGGPFEGIEALSKLAPTKQANQGFTSLSTGESAYFIWSLVIVTSIAVWAQPQMIQRHFSISSKSEIKKAALLASLSLLLIVGGMYFIAALSRLVLPEISRPDMVIPLLVDNLLPEAGKQLFVLAIISASLSTCTALFHIASSSLTEDLFDKKATKKTWFIAIVICILVSGFTAQLEGKLIAIIHTTAWSVIGATALVPYLALVLLKHSNSYAAFTSSTLGFLSCFLFYVFVTPSTRFVEISSIPQEITVLPPFVVGLAISTIAYMLTSLVTKSSKIAIKTVLDKRNIRDEEESRSNSLTLELVNE